MPKGATKKEAEEGLARYAAPGALVVRRGKSGYRLVLP